MRQNDTETTFYLYDREDRIADYDQSGNLITAYTHGPGIDEPVAMTLNNSTYFYIPDIQGSIRAIISADNGSLAAYYTYDAWGNLVSYGGSLVEKNDYLYTGREYDWQIGIYYYRYRYYNPEIGRFLQSSWELNKEMNMYVYLGNDPANNEDPTGHPGYVPPYLHDHGGGSICHAGCLTVALYNRAYSFMHCICEGICGATSWTEANRAIHEVIDEATNDAAKMDPLGCSQKLGKISSGIISGETRPWGPWTRSIKNKEIYIIREKTPEFGIKPGLWRVHWWVI